MWNKTDRLFWKQSYTLARQLVRLRAQFEHIEHCQQEHNRGIPYDKRNNKDIQNERLDTEFVQERIVSRTYSQFGHLYRKFQYSELTGWL